MKTAKVNNLVLAKNTKQIVITIDAKDSMYVGDAMQYGFPTLLNSDPLVEGLNILLEQGYHAVDAMKGNTEFIGLSEENKKLKSGILKSDLAQRVRQFLSALDYATLSDYQAKCVLLLEKELK